MHHVFNVSLYSLTLSRGGVNIYFSLFMPSLFDLSSYLDTFLTFDCNTFVTLIKKLGGDPIYPFLCGCFFSDHTRSFVKPPAI